MIAFMGQDQYYQAKWCDERVARLTGNKIGLPPSTKRRPRRRAPEVPQASRINPSVWLREFGYIK
jgi:hypothetical protein